jgi:hypothetical protein
VLLVAAIVAAFMIVRNGHGQSPVAAQPPPAVITPSTTPPAAVPPADPAPDAHDQAVAVDGLLGASVASRRKLNAAIDLVNRCTSLSTALADMQSVGAERQEQLSTIQSADLSALNDGESLRTELSAALTNALAADQAYVDWTAPTVSNGCANTAARKAAFARGRAASDGAQAAKKRFLVIWNPIAVEEGLAERSSTDI